MTPVALSILASGVVVVIAGIILGRAADRIADLTYLGRVWTGAVLLAAATSLPELVTDVSAVRQQTHNLAAGDLFGSSLTNMLILAVIDLLPVRQRILNHTSFNVALAACLAIILNALGAAFTVVHSTRTFLALRPESTLLLIIYVAGTRAVYRHGVKAEEKSPPRAAATDSPAGPGCSLYRAVGEFVVGTALIFVAAPEFARSAASLAKISGLGTFVRRDLDTEVFHRASRVCYLADGGQNWGFDLAVATLFGSSAFNMVIFFPMDLASHGGSVFGALDPVHALSGSLAVVLMSLALAAIVYRTDRRLGLLEPGSGLILASYALTIWLLYAFAR